MSITSARFAVFVLLLLGASVCRAGEVTVTIDDTKVLFTTPEAFHGTNFCALWNDTGDSPGTVKAFSQMGSKLLRFPGGVPCQWYDWKEPLATGWTKITPENAWGLAKSGGATMLFQTDSANDTAGENKDTKGKYKFDSSGAHAAEWASWAKEKKIPVAFWEIGNEPEMDAPGNVKTSQETIFTWYNAKFEEQAKAIKKADPDAKIMGPASTNTWFWWHEKNIDKFMKAEGNKSGSGLVDAVSIHWYPGGGGAPWEKQRGTAQGWTGCMDYIKKAITDNDSRTLPLYITEWNWGAGDKDDSNSYLGNALGCADCIGMFLRTGVAGQTHFCLQKVQRGWGVLGMSKDSVAQNAPNPTYFALAVASHLSGKVLEVKNSADEGNVLSAYATRNDKGLEVMLINKSDAAQTVKLAFSKFNPDQKKVLTYTLKGAKGNPLDSTVVYNGVEAPKPADSDLPPATSSTAGAAVTQTLEPFSLVVMVFAEK
jgi:hypothetical protein